MARFFISHGAVEGSVAETLLHEILRRLEEQSHQAFADTMIEVGDAWRPVLFDELVRCDIGVVLLDRRALASEWVRREVHYLLWRDHLHSARILVVLLDGLTADDLKAASDAYSELTEIQLIRAGREDDLGAIADRTLRGIGPAERLPDPMRRWLDSLASVIRRVWADGMLGHFAVEIGITEHDLYGVLEHERPRFVAHQLIGRPHPKQTLHAVLAVEPAVGRADATLLARNALPALVDAEAARHLLRRGRVFVLNARFESTFVLYVLRAVCRDTRVSYGMVAAQGGIDLAMDLERICERKLMQILGMRPDDPTATTQLAEYGRLPQEARGIESVYLAIEAAHGQMTAVAEVIRRLRGRYHWVTLIVLSGARPPGDTEGWGVGDVVILDPALAPGEEDELDRVINIFRARIDERLLR